MAWGSFGWGSFYWGLTPVGVVPAASADRVCGEGLWVAQKESYGTNVRTLGRIRLDDPSAPGTNLGPPTFQFQLVVNPAGTPDFWALLHGSSVRAIILKPLNYGQDPNVGPGHSRLVTLNAATSGRALSALYHSTEGLVTIWNNRIAGASMGVDFHTGIGTLVAGAVPAITGVQLGFSAAQNVSLQWVSFAARENTDGMVTVLGLAHDTTTARTRPGESGSYTLYRFTLDPSVVPGPGAVVETVQAVVSDLPFAPHQLAEGNNLPLNANPRTRYLWCAGRFDPEKLNPSVTPINQTGFCTMGAEGLWVTEDVETMTNWRMVWNSAVGVSYPLTDHVLFAGQNDQPRDLGLVFDESWQRLSFFGIDTDPSQDPVQERPVFRFH